VCKDCGEIQRVGKDHRCDLCHELWIREGLKDAIRCMVPMSVPVGNRWGEDVEESVVNPAKEGEG